MLADGANTITAQIALTHADRSFVTRKTKRGMWRRSSPNGSTRLTSGHRDAMARTRPLARGGNSEGALRRWFRCRR